MFFVVRFHKHNFSLRYRGLSYVELLIAAVIMSILFVSGLRLFGNLAVSTQAVTEQDAAFDLAVGLIEEIQQQAYRDPGDTSTALGLNAGELANNRGTYDDIDDYNGLNESPPVDRWGNEIAQYQNFTQKVDVSYVSAGDFSVAASGDEGFKKVVVTVLRDDKALAEQTYVLADLDHQ